MDITVTSGATHYKEAFIYKEPSEDVQQVKHELIELRKLKRFETVYQSLVDQVTLLGYHVMELGGDLHDLKLNKQDKLDLTLLAKQESVEDLSEGLERIKTQHGALLQHMSSKTEALQAIMNEHTDYFGTLNEKLAEHNTQLMKLSSEQVFHVKRTDAELIRIRENLQRMINDTLEFAKTTEENLKRAEREANKHITVLRELTRSDQEELCERIDTSLIRIQATVPVIKAQGWRAWLLRFLGITWS